MSTGLQVVYSVCVHRSGGETGLHRLYWSDSVSRKIFSVKLDGTDRDLYEHVTVDFSGPSGLLWDWQSAKLVFTDTWADAIRRSNFYNGKAETIVSDIPNDPKYIAIDENQRKLYWTVSSKGKVQRSDLDGGRKEDVVISGLNDPAGIAIVPAQTTTTTRTTTTATTTTSTSTTSTSTTSTSTSTTSTSSTTTTMLPSAITQLASDLLQISTTAKVAVERASHDFSRTGISSTRLVMPSLQVCTLLATVLSVFHIAP